jgi:hypothetical protein
MRIVGAELVNNAEESHNETGGISLVLLVCRCLMKKMGPCQLVVLSCY